MLCGIDEAGRGSLAGPLVVAGCILHEKLNGLNDSKKLTPKKREELFEALHVKSEFIILYFSNTQIDEDGLSFCLKKALEIIQLKFHKHQFLFDGNTNYGVKAIKTQIKADIDILEVSAASILAKVSRDRLMKKFDKVYPQYGFSNHKGYGTNLHVENIKKFGFCPIHRKSFKIKTLS